MISILIESFHYLLLLFNKNQQLYTANYMRRTVLRLNFSSSTFLSDRKNKNNPALKKLDYTIILCKFFKSNNFKSRRVTTHHLIELNLLTQPYFIFVFLEKFFSRSSRLIKRTYKRKLNFLDINSTIFRIRMGANYQFHL